ncbi:hypothetical protein J437_LFUL004289 [Ladona fulva]|uniref:Uncharacterized protein n=1 Tax=Ladona fulva TaxID=123851 RepID=A0A8K0JXQ9_LADFU|nr:hypothetical protein J437_LFUL004289 [Ladona fulva]
MGLRIAAIALALSCLIRLASPQTSLPDVRKAANYLAAAVQELQGNHGFSSKADFVSPDDDIDAGVVREDYASEKEDHSYQHSLHAQMIRSQHKPSQQYGPPPPQPPPAPSYPSPVYHHHPPASEKPPASEYPPQQYPPQQYPPQQYPPPQYPPQQYPPHQPESEAPPSDYHPEAVNGDVPPISKEELAALYDAAVQKGTQLDLANLPGGVEGLGDPSTGAMPGYYYYYYPIKDFPKKEEGMGNGDMKEEGNGMENGNGNEAKMVEPLFIAVAAFTGLSLLFMFSMIFLPKLGFFRSDNIGMLSKLAPDDLSGLTRVVLESVDGKDCDQRIACELGRVLRKLRMHDRPLR